MDTTQSQVKKTILIPTDFSIESLKLLKEAVNTLDNRSVNIVFLHCIHLSDSIIDLIFFSKKELLESLVNTDFNDACKILKNKYEGKIHSIRTEIFLGNTQQAFHNFLDANRIDEILFPKNYSFNKINKRSFSPKSFIMKSKILVTEIAFEQAVSIPEKGKLAEIFLL